MKRPDVEKYEAMAEAATVGPWSMNNVGGTVWPGHCAVRGPIGAEYQGAYLREGDAALIAAARTAIPELCAYIRELEGMLRARADERRGYNPPPTDATPPDKPPPPPPPKTADSTGMIGH